MAAYAIGYLTLRNTDWLEEYGAHMPALAKKHGGKPLAKVAPVVMEGSPLLSETQIIVEFPSMEHAQAWYDDPAHVPLKKLREGGADFSMVLLNGL
ncbi:MULTISPECIES: DUF1330 domain-containing protein [unclassified Duganella]|uniref:DUF1330 domain-containing protein n=1 Tax=unclassified Duganella TaxID=2636909 RepID=UPI000E34F5E2|nr:MULTISPECIES: DUF1330 domain-containing protein [unclassified Duganella]RFP16358.1 DUF1330 domain-containing protein [Duganella sp. BJB475]RFP32481.1 DUF1330 domain-containing protein [Duganella sp. BJB476]